MSGEKLQLCPRPDEGLRLLLYPPTPRGLALWPCVLSGVRSTMAPVCLEFVETWAGEEWCGERAVGHGDGDRRSHFSQGRARLSQGLPPVTWVPVQRA